MGYLVSDQYHLMAEQNVGQLVRTIQMCYLYLCSRFENVMLKGIMCNIVVTERITVAVIKKCCYTNSPEMLWHRTETVLHLWPAVGG